MGGGDRDEDEAQSGVGAERTRGSGLQGRGVTGPDAQRVRRCCRGKGQKGPGQRPPRAGEHERAGVAGLGWVRLERRAVPNAPGSACRLPSPTPSTPRRAPGPRNCLQEAELTPSATRGQQRTPLGKTRAAGLPLSALRALGTRFGNHGRILASASLHFSAPILLISSHASPF